MYGKWLAIPKWKMTALLLNQEKTANMLESETFDVRKKQVHFVLNKWLLQFQYSDCFHDFKKGGNSTHTFFVAHIRLAG